MRGLVMSGGGVKGAFQAGVLEKLCREDPTLDYGFISGVSVGAINALMVAQHQKLENAVKGLMQLWPDIETKDVRRKFKLWPPNISWLGPFRLFFQDGLYDTTPLLQLIEKNYNPEGLAQGGKILRLGIAEKTTGQYFEITEKDDNIPQWALASASFPLALVSQIGDEGVYTDGGLIHITPLKSAIMQGCTKIDVILTGPLYTPKVKKEEILNVVSSGKRSLDIMASAIWRNDFKICHLINQLAENGHDKYRKIDVTVYAPKSSILRKGVGDLDFIPKDIRKMIDLGRGVEGVSLEEFLDAEPHVIPKSL